MSVSMGLKSNYLKLNKITKILLSIRTRDPLKKCEKYPVEWGKLPTLNVFRANFARVKPFTVFICAARDYFLESDLAFSGAKAAASPPSSEASKAGVTDRDCDD